MGIISFMCPRFSDEQIGWLNVPIHYAFGVPRHDNAQIRSLN